MWIQFSNTTTFKHYITFILFGYGISIQQRLSVTSLQSKQNRGKEDKGLLPLLSLRRWPWDKAEQSWVQQNQDTAKEQLISASVTARGSSASLFPFHLDSCSKSRSQKSIPKQQQCIHGSHFPSLYKSYKYTTLNISHRMYDAWQFHSICELNLATKQESCDLRIDKCILNSLLL